MNFIEKEKLIKADIVSIENRVRHAFNQGYDLGFKDGKKAKPQDIDYKEQYERLSKKAEIVISQLRADRDRLLSLPSVTPQEPRWIPVSERLPEPYQNILVTIEDFHWENEPVRYSVRQKSFNGSVNFVAWMPLPKAYREVEE